MIPQPTRLARAAPALLLAALAACSPAPTPAKPPPPTAAAQVSDIDVTEHVKTALHQAPSLQGLDIGVETLNGDVRLSGVLASQAQIDDALGIARAAEGAHAVHDHLTIRP